MELHQLQKDPGYDGDLSPCQVSIRLDKAFSSWSLETKMWTEVGHLNLIGGLVTRNPPKKDALLRVAATYEK